MATSQAALLLAVHILLISEFILAKRDYYDILGVPKDASERLIKKTFHKLALKYHPDRNKGPDAEAKFREIAEAYETLSDDKRRREYDQFGHGPSSGEGYQGGGGHYDFNKHYHSFNFDNIFKDSETFGQQHHHHFHSHAYAHAQAHAHAHAQAQANANAHFHNEAHQKKHFDNPFQAHQEAMNRHKRQFEQGAFGGGVFDDMFENMENMFSFHTHTHTHSSTSDGGFQNTQKQNCKTVTQRRGNMVTTFTDCS